MTEGSLRPPRERDVAGVLTPPDALPVARRRVGRYEVVDQIGRGGMAIVYLARQESLDRDVALKELSSFQTGAPQMAQRFLREALLAGSLNHPNIVTVLEHFEHDGVPYIAMEYVPQGSLRPFLGALTLAQFAGLIEGVLAGLAHAAEFGIVHRDVKPENIMVTADGRVKIADFGIAKATQTAATAAFVTASGMTVGTPAYMAPEQAMGEEVGCYTDLYSVGVMAWEHVVGRLPFNDSHTPVAILMRQVNEQIPSACDLVPDADPEISAWIDRLLFKDPGARPQSPLAAWDELEEITVAKLGPWWRRQARLPSAGSVSETRRPLTPAFPEGHQASTLTPTIRPTEGPAGDRVPAPPADQTPAEATEPSKAADSPEERLDPDTEPAPATAAPPRVGFVPATTRGRIVALGAALALAGAVLGFVVAPSSGGSSARARATAGAASAGPLSVSIPKDWQRRTPTATPDVKLTNAIAIAPRDAVDEALTVGRATTSDPTLLPGTLLSALSSPPKAQVVDLGRAQFYRYRDLSPRGAASTETVYALPTTIGTVLGICSGGSRPVSGCEAALAALRLARGELLGLGPSASFAAGLNRAVATLNASAGRVNTALRTAGTPAAQASAANQLSTDYGRAATAVRALPAGQAAAAASSLAGALQKTATDYRSLAGAASGENSGVYKAAQNALKTDASSVSAAFTALGRFGYVT